MEKIKVNMSPNPLDVQTIHASQNDGEAREWEFELHNNGELIDTSDVKEQLVFKAYKGGTEQLLPENTSTPTTSPFKGDIRYPQGLLTDQEFTYRQSPTEEDGLAKITDIKGNTLVWNQLVEKGNMTDGWAFSNSTGSYSNNILTFTASAQGGFVRPNLPQPIISGHKYLGTVDVKGTSAFSSNILFVGRSEGELNSVSVSTSWQTFAKVFTNTVTENNYFPRVSDRRSSGWDAVQVRNCMLIDLTQMGLDSITSASEFTSLFPLSYYSYNQGSLLSFNGNGIKTVGKNLLEPTTSGSVSGVTFTVNNDGSITVNGTATSNGTYDFYRSTTALPSWAKVGETYTLSLTNPINRFSIHSYDSSGTVTALVDTSTASRVFTIPNDAVGLLIRIFVTSGVTYDVTVYPQIEIGTSATSYEPYTSSTTNLPISTYFPTGMKSAGNVYDELTSDKTITRLIKTTVDGTNTLANYYGVFQGHQLFYIDVFAPTYVDYSNMENLKSNHYLTAINVTMNDRYIRYQALDNRANIGRIYWNDDRYTSADAINTALQSDPLEIISLAQAPTETSFTTASLVTENAEIPLSNEDGVLIGKCTEQLSENPGFIDAKIKLSDADGTCYSNKLQLHVERSPQ